MWRNFRLGGCNTNRTPVWLLLELFLMCGALQRCFWLHTAGCLVFVQSLVDTTNSPCRHQGLKMWTNDERLFFVPPSWRKNKVTVCQTVSEWGNERHHLGGHTCSCSVYTLALCRFGLYCAPYGSTVMWGVMQKHDVWIIFALQDFSALRCWSVDEKHDKAFFKQLLWQQS